MSPHIENLSSSATFKTNHCHIQNHRCGQHHRNWWHSYGKHHQQFGVLSFPRASLIAVPMLSPKSYTHEDVIELQCHGSEVCLRRVLRSCLEAGARLTEPGEFTLRAFLNGRLDLSQAENIGKLISAKSTAAADAELGGFSSLVKSLRAQCIELLTEIEARLDFDDEMPPLDLNLITDKIHTMLLEVDDALETTNYDKLLHWSTAIRRLGMLILRYALGVDHNSSMNNGQLGGGI